jgi:hypothetical protein
MARSHVAHPGNANDPGCAKTPEALDRLVWSSGRAAEGARLESVYTGNRIEGSNPSPSARSPYFACAENVGISFLPSPIIS